MDNRLRRYQRAARMKDAGFDICLVSPELQGRPGDIASYRLLLAREGIVPDMVCTKLSSLDVWQTPAFSPDGDGHGDGPPA